MKIGTAQPTPLYNTQQNVPEIWWLGFRVWGLFKQADIHIFYERQGGSQECMPYKYTEHASMLLQIWLRQPEQVLKVMINA